MKDIDGQERMSIEAMNGRSGVSVERRQLSDEKYAALCRDAATEPMFMKNSVHPNERERGRPNPAESDDAFTLTELLVVLAVLAFLAITLVPALAATKHNSKLIQCQSNLRQIGAACTMYADDFKGWYPIVSLGAPNNYGSGRVNFINWIHYTRYIYLNDTGTDGDIMPQYLKSSTDPSKGFQDQNLGYLYAEGLVTDGHTFFCPSINDITDPNAPLYYLRAEFYSNPQFMSTHSNGSIRSGYMFNPRLVNPAGGNNQRQYQRAGDVHQRDVFTIDYLEAQAPSLDYPTHYGCPFTPLYWAHWPGKGLNALFTDGSAKFCAITNSALFNGIVNNLVLSEGTESLVQYNTIFNALRDSP